MDPQPWCTDNKAESDLDLEPRAAVTTIKMNQQLLSSRLWDSLSQRLWRWTITWTRVLSQLHSWRMATAVHQHLLQWHLIITISRSGKSKTLWKETISATVDCIDNFHSGTNRRRRGDWSSRRGGDVGEAELLEKPYHCNPPCEFSTTTKGNLLQHQNNSRCYHKRPFACDKCSQRFTTQHGKDQHFVKGRCGVWVWRGDPSMMWFCIAFIDALKITMQCNVGVIVIIDGT